MLQATFNCTISIVIVVRITPKTKLCDRVSNRTRLGGMLSYYDRVAA